MNETDIRRGATSASNAQADALCPGRHLAQKGIADPPASADAQFGRIIHAALAYSGETERMTVMTGEQRDIFDSCREIEKKAIAQFFGEDPTPKRVFREQRYWCMVPIPLVHNAGFEHSGQPDVVVRAGPRALIMEYKTLPSEIPGSPSNLQLRDQVVLTAGSLILSEVGVAVIQPLVTHSPEVTLYTKEAIKLAEVEMFERVRRSNDPASPRTPGEVQCKFCRARSTCQEYQQFAGSQLPVEKGILDVPMSLWTGPQCALFADGRAVAQKWLDDATELVKARLAANGDSVPGWELTPGDNKLKITNPQELFNRFQASGGTLDQYMACVAITKGKLEEQVRAVTQLKGKSLKTKIEELLAGLVETKQNAPSLGRKKQQTTNQ